jgi:transcription elongation factor GreB
MSKAFTTDSDDDGTILEAPALPPGTRNYMTAVGAERLRAEAEQLDQERKRLAADAQGKDRAQVIERRLRYLVPRIEALEVIDPLAQPKDRVLFGASVTISNDKGKSETWRIVGLDEIHLDQGWISWMSPLASALLEKRVGDIVPFMGRRLTVLQINYNT